MKKILAFTFILLVTLGGALALSADTSINFGSDDSPVRRSNPEARNSDDRISTASTSFVVQNPFNESVMIQSVEFIASGPSKYRTQDFGMNASHSSFTLGSQSSQTITLETVVPRYINSLMTTDSAGELDTLQPGQVGSVRVTYVDPNTSGTTQLSVPVFMYAEFMMEVEAFVRINSQRYDLDEDEIEELTPRDTVELCVVVENLFDERDDRVDMEVDVTFRTNNRDFDPDDRNVDQDVDAGRKEEICVGVDIDPSIDDDERINVDITVVGTDDNNAEYRAAYSFRVEFSPPRGEVQIRSFTLSPSSVCQGGVVTANFEVENIGSDRQGLVRVQLQENTLGLNQVFSGITLERGTGRSVRDNTYANSYTFSVPRNANAQEYNVRVIVFYRDDRRRDVSRFEDFKLEVRDCTQTTPTTPSVPNQTQNNGSIDVMPGGSAPVTPGGVVTSPTTVVARPVSGGTQTNTGLYIAGLVALIVVVLIVLIYLVVLLTRR